MQCYGSQLIELLLIGKNRCGGLIGRWHKRCNCVSSAMALCITVGLANKDSEYGIAGGLICEEDDSIGDAEIRERSWLQSAVLPFCPFPFTAGSRPFLFVASVFKCHSSVWWCINEQSLAATSARFVCCSYHPSLLLPAYLILQPPFWVSTVHKTGVCFDFFIDTCIQKVDLATTIVCCKLRKRR